MVYGTLTELPGSAQPRTSTFKKAAAVSVAVLMCLGFASVSHTRSVVMQRTLNANKARASASPVSPLVAEKTAEVVNVTENGLRWAIFGFDSTEGDDVRTIVPLMQGKATDDWRGDWDRFIAALPENDCAAAVYNFQYWVAAQSNMVTDADGVETEEIDPEYFDLDPLLITWAPASIEAREVARYGYYLGALIVATDHPDPDFDLEVIGLDGLDGEGYGAFNDEGGNGYKNFCMYREAQKGREGADAEEVCDMIDDFHNCPFTDAEQVQVSTEVAVVNPCVTSEVQQCRGAQFIAPDPNDPETVAGAMTWECCAYIQDFCGQIEGAGLEVAGCNTDALDTITALCESRAPEDEIECMGDCGAVPCDGTAEVSTYQSAPDCAQPCPLMDSPADTFQKCSGCPTNGLPQPNGLTYQCHKEAFGFLDMRCCGLHPECEDAANQNEESCNTFDSGVDLNAKRCSWTKHAQCQAVIDTQMTEFLYGQVTSDTGEDVPNTEMAQPLTITTGAKYGCCTTTTPAAEEGGEPTIENTPSFDVQCPTGTPVVIADIDGGASYEYDAEPISDCADCGVFTELGEAGADACAAVIEAQGGER